MDVTRMSVDQLPNMLCLGTLWLRLYRKWRYASTSIEYRASQILYLLLSPTSALIWCRHGFLLQPLWHFARNEHEHNGKKNRTRAKYSMQIWFNQIQSQQLYSKRKSKNFVAFGVKCDWKLAILQISWIVWMVACWFFAFPLSLTPPAPPFNDDKYIFTLYDDGKSKPTEKKNVSRFCFGYHWTHSHIDSDFNFLLRSIHPFKSIICFCYGRHRNLFLLFPSHSLSTFSHHLGYILLSFVWVSHFANFTHEIEDRIILSENPLNQKWYG